MIERSEAELARLKAKIEAAGLVIVQVDQGGAGESA